MLKIVVGQQMIDGDHDLPGGVRLVAAERLHHVGIFRGEKALKLVNDVVAARIGPVVGRDESFQITVEGLSVAAEMNDVPGTVNLCVGDSVTVISIRNDGAFRFEAVVLQEFRHFVRREPDGG